MSQPITATPVVNVISAGSAPLPSFEKLKGQDNWNLWKFLMEKYLDYDDLWEVTDPSREENLVVPGNSDGELETKRKHRKAFTKITLMVEPSCVVHIRESKTPADAWKRSAATHENKGLNRRLRLMRALFNVHLDNYPNMTAYVTEVISLQQQLSAISDPIDDEYLGVILLKGLPSSYEPLVQALENMEIKIKSELVKSKLLDQADSSMNSNSSSGSSAFAVAQNTSGFDRSKVRCYACNNVGHIARFCKSRKGGSNDNKSTYSKAHKPKGNFKKNVQESECFAVIFKSCPTIVLRYLMI